MSEHEIMPKKRVGRPASSGRYGEPTALVRVPVSQKSNVLQYLDAFNRKRNPASPAEVGDIQPAHPQPWTQALPLYSSRVPAGLPSPADEHVEDRLDINRYLIEKVDTTFLVTVGGDSMMEAGLLRGDKAVVDRSKEAKLGDRVLAVVDGEFTIKLLSRHKNGMPLLLPANSSGQFKPIEIHPETRFEIWGVVTGAVRKF